MYSQFKDGFYTNGEIIFELHVGISMRFRMADGTCRYCPPELTIYLADMFDRQSLKVPEWADKYMIFQDMERALKLLEPAVYLGTLDD